MAKVTGPFLAEKVCKALGLDPNLVAHVEIILDPNGAAYASIKMYIEGPAGDRMVS